MIPYWLFTGSLNNPILGVIYVNVINTIVNTVKIAIAVGLLHLLSDIIYLYDIYSPKMIETKKLPMSKNAKLIPIIPV